MILRPRHSPVSEERIAEGATVILTDSDYAARYRAWHEELMPDRNLTIYLITKGLTDHAAIVKAEVDHYQISVNGRAIGDLYVKPVQPHPPPWVELFAEAGTGPDKRQRDGHQRRTHRAHG